ncbi:MAG: ABC transporter substrate-binding protein [Clostridiales Family XIII bacterium]|jgi:peptide/nickel transport system substrate-binding protein|nr:ABC transporter substrate-binding protein [Clostridiales Family XIII bacterium]
MKKNICFVLLFIMILTLTACGSSGGGDSASPSESSGDGTKVFVYGADANSATFDPCADLQMRSGAFLLLAAGETLWTVDEKGEKIMKLAESAEWTSDLVLTVKLREGVKYSNGNDFNADDVIYTIQHMQTTPRTEAMLANIDMDATKALDDMTVEIVFKAYDAAFMDTLGNQGFSMLDKESCDERGDFSWFIGTGPYKLAGDGVNDKSGWTESVEYHFVRNENYWGDAPYYDELYCKFYSEESTRYSDLVAGNLDAAYFSQATYINNIKDGTVDGATLAQFEMPGVYGLTLAAGDGSNGALKDINIRKAIAHGIDIESIVNEIGEGVYNVADSVLTPNNWAYLNTGVYEFNAAQAKQDIDKAGYSASKPLNLRLVAESTAFNLGVAEAVQAYLSEVGINLDLSGMGDFSTILPRLIENDLEMSIGGPSNGSGNDPASVLQQLGPMSNNGLLRVTDPSLADLFNKGATTKDQAARVDIYKQFQQKIHDDYLFIPMWVETLNYGVSDTHKSFSDAVNANCLLDPCKLTD